MGALILVIPGIIIDLAFILGIRYLDKYEREHTPNDGYNI
jgi:hypothetical protein